MLPVLFQVWQVILTYIDLPFNRLKAYCDKDGKDIFFVMNGDFMDGTGLSKIPPKELVPIIQSMPFDAINIGNHELYHNEVIEYITKEMLGHRHYEHRCHTILTRFRELRLKWFVVVERQKRRS